MKNMFGIEKISVYPSTMALDIAMLCEHRGVDPAIKNQLMVDQRAVIPPWEDTVTLAVNAANEMLNQEDRQAIQLLIVGTETAMDQEKPISSWVHRYLNLGPQCRNFEIKHACYATTAALQMALAWLESIDNPHAKALIIAADLSLIGFSEPAEPALGAGAVAVLLSRSPSLIAYEKGCSGVYSQDVTDVIRPTPRVETGNSELSLFSYMEALEATYTNYLSACGRHINFEQDFAWHLYHMPFPGMAWQAHRRLLTLHCPSLTVSEIREHFNTKVKPSLTFNRYLGSTYGGSTFIGLLGLAANASVHAGDRVAIFSYGSGSCAEFYSGIIQPDAAQVAKEANVEEKIAARTLLSIGDYEACERWRDAHVGVADHHPPREMLGNAYNRHYTDRGLLVLEEVKDYTRYYSWS